MRPLLFCDWTGGIVGVTRRAVKSGVSPDETTTKELQSFVKARLLPHKYPRMVEYVDELPKTGTGKIDRQQLLKYT